MFKYCDILRIIYAPVLIIQEILSNPQQICSSSQVLQCLGVKREANLG